MKQDRSAYLGALFAAGNREAKPHSIANDVTELRSIAQAISRLAVAACNVGLSERQEKRWEGLATRAAAIALPYGFVATCHGDPRGYVVKLRSPTDESAGDGWGGGWGVY